MSKSEPSQSPSSTQGFHLSRLGKYTIEKRLGAGGMGTVFLATDDSLKRTVALKILKKEQAENPTLVRRFQAEGQAAAVLEHKNIVRVYDAGKADGYLYIALEYVDGVDVLHWIHKRGPVPLKRSIDIIRQVAAALEHAQSKHIVHRDIKPSNLMIMKDGTVKLADMGLARSIDETIDTSITRDGTTVGTVDYMPPEQAANSKAADIRSDIYSLGCTWYHMLTGQLPFPNGSIHNKLSDHLKTPPPDPRELNSEITEAVVAVIHRMMAKAPQQRHQTAIELLADLDVEKLTRAGTPSNLLAMLTEEDDVPDDPSIANDDWTALSRDASEAPMADESPAQAKPESRSSQPRKKKSKRPSESESKARKKKPRSRDLPKPDNEAGSEPKKPTATPTETTTKSPTTPETPISKKRKPTKKKGSKPKPPPQAPRAHSSTDSTAAEAPPESQTESKTNAAQPSHPSKRVRTQRTKPPAATEPEARPAPPRERSQRELPQREDEKENGSKAAKSAGVEVDFTRIGIVAAIVLAIGFAIWWIANQGDHPADSGSPTAPYSTENEVNSAENDVELTDLDHSQIPPENNLEVIVANDGSESTESQTNSTSSTSPKQKAQVLPPWMQDDWSLPSPLEKGTLVGRGQQSLNLNEALFGQAFVKNLELFQTTIYWPKHAFIEDSERLSIRASAGTSPVIAIGESQIKDSKWLTYSGETLIFEGIHFVLNLTEPRQTPVTLFDLTGTRLVMRDCTVTVLGDGNVPVHVINSTGSSVGESQILLERIHFRGRRLTAVYLNNGEGDVVVKDSLIVSGDAPVTQIEHEPSTKNSSQLRVIHSSLFSNNSILNAQRKTALDQENGELEVIVRDSMLVNQDDRPGTAFQLSQWFVPTSATEPTQFNGSVSMSIADSTLSGWPSLVDATTGNGTIISVQSASEWNALWQDDLRPEALVKHVPHDLVASTPPSKLNANQTAIGCDAHKLRWLPEPYARRVELASGYLPIQPLYRENMFPTTKEFDLKNTARLQEFIDSPACPDGTHLTLIGSGLVSISEIRLTNRKLRFEFKSNLSTSRSLKGIAPEPATIQPTFQMKGNALFNISGGHIEFVRTKVNLTNSNACTLFTIRDHAEVALDGMQVRLQATDKNIPALIDCHSAKSISIANSTLEGDRPLLQFHGSCDQVKLQDCLMLSGADAISIDAQGQFGPVQIDSSTFFANGSVFRVQKKPNLPAIDVILNECLFLSSHQDQTPDSLLMVKDENSLADSVNWLETGCGFETQDAMKIAYLESTIPADHALKWREAPTQLRVIDAISGPKFVFRNPGETSLSRRNLAGFQLDASCPAATWSILGGPIGGDFRKIRSSPITERTMKRGQPRVRPNL